MDVDAETSSLSKLLVMRPFPRCERRAHGFGAPGRKITLRFRPDQPGDPFPRLLQRRGASPASA